MTAARRPMDPTRRLLLILALGGLAVAVLLAVPGAPPPPSFAPPPDPAREVTPSMTPPRVVDSTAALAMYDAYEMTQVTQQGMSGTVEVRVRVDEQGRVGKAKGWRWSGPGDLVPIAELVAAAYRFSPGLDEQRRPVPVWWTTTVAFPPALMLEHDGIDRRWSPDGRVAHPEGYRMEDLEGQRPIFTPLTEPPRFLNPEEVASAKLQAPATYVPEIPNGLRTRVFFLVDTVGEVREVQIHHNGGDPYVDQVALRVARLHRFSPALLDGRPVPAWISLPIYLGGQPVVAPPITSEGEARPGARGG